MPAELSMEGLTLHVADVQRSVDFYLRFPGARLLYRRPGQYEFALLRIGRTRLGLLGHNAPGFQIEVSSSDLDATYADMEAAGVTPTDRPTQQRWGDRAFHTVDPDGNRIRFDTQLGIY